MNDQVESGSSAAGDPRLRSAALKLWAALLSRVASISESEAKVSVRGFLDVSPHATERLEAIGRHFVRGYNAAVGSHSLADIEASLAQQPLEYSGFCHEGAAMGICIADWLTPGRRLFDAYVRGPARHHEYMAWVGAGWALARLPVSPLTFLQRYSGITRWLALDGYGFHSGYFHPRRYVTDQKPPRLSGDAARIFDQGLGRSLWFSRGTNTEAVARCIQSFAMPRRADLWSGAGLAATYAGGTVPEALRRLREAAEEYGPALAQGVVFAAEARRRAGNLADHVNMASMELAGLPAIDAANLAVAERPGHGDDLAAYQNWRLGIQRRFTSRVHTESPDQ